MPYDTTEHYERLAREYDGNWDHSPQYVAWMAQRIAEDVRVTPGERMVDIGSGTGLFLREVVKNATAQTPIVCVDPFQHMLDQLPDDPRLTPVCATAEDIATRRVELPYDTYDVIAFKEAIHHVEDIPATLAALADRLRPGGRMHIVTLPPHLDYPIFQAARDRFAENQPEPDDIAQSMRDAGLKVDMVYHGLSITVDREHYIELVRRRWMSVLSTFSEDELEAGIDEIRSSYPQPEVTYTNRFAFILGLRE